MKKIVTASVMMFIGSLAFGQRGVERDPTYSVHNYKHPNKAAYARKHNLDRMTVLETVEVRQNDNYKQPRNNGAITKKGALVSRKMDKSTKSYKHPNGL